MTSPLPADVRTGQEFLGLLRDLLRRSGRSAGHVATYAGIPRSTAYHFVSERNSTLPTNREYLERFVQACKPEPGELEQVMQAWDRLSNAGKSEAQVGYLIPRRMRTLKPRISSGIIPSGISADPEASGGAGSEVRGELRSIFRRAGLSGYQLLEPVAGELRQRGFRPRKAWRLANELTQQGVAERYNQITGKPSAPMKASRISEFESWPGPRGAERNRPRPTVQVLQILASIYGTSWVQLVDSADLLAMPDEDVQAYRDAVVEGSSGGLSRRPSRKPRVFISYTYDEREHAAAVRRFGAFLAGYCGLDIHLDHSDAFQRRDWRKDWFGWVVDQITAADFILIIASEGYKEAAEGKISAATGHGRQYEVSILMDRLHSDRATWLPKLLPVVLPGHSVEEIPYFLTPGTTAYYTVSEFTIDGAEDLLRALTDTR